MSKLFLYCVPFILCTCSNCCGTLFTNGIHMLPPQDRYCLLRQALDCTEDQGKGAYEYHQQSMTRELQALYGITSKACTHAQDCHQQCFIQTFWQGGAKQSFGNAREGGISFHHCIFSNFKGGTQNPREGGISFDQCIFSNFKGALRIQGRANVLPTPSPLNETLLLIFVCTTTFQHVVLVQCQQIR